MSHKVNMIRQRFGRLVVLEEIEPKVFSSGRFTRQFLCECDCGTKKPVGIVPLRNGDTQSCGCLFSENLSKISTTHGLSKGYKKDPILGIWNNIKTRCFLENSPRYPRYGGRGITMCAGWRDDAGAFARDMGPRPSPKHSTDRKDNDGHYSCGKCSECVENGWPANCRWATQEEQCNNKSTNIVIEHDGKSLTIAEWSRLLDIPRHVFEDRISTGIAGDKLFYEDDLRVLRGNRIHAFGKTKLLSEWADEFGLKKGTIYARYALRGWCVECAISEPTVGGKCEHIGHSVRS